MFDDWDSDDEKGSGGGSPKVTPKETVKSPKTAKSSESNTNGKAKLDNSVLNAELDSESILPAPIIKPKQNQNQTSSQNLNKSNIDIRGKTAQLLKKRQADRKKNNIYLQDDSDNENQSGGPGSDINDIDSDNDIEQNNIINSNGPNYASAKRQKIEQREQIRKEKEKLEQQRREQNKVNIPGMEVKSLNILSGLRQPNRTLDKMFKTQTTDVKTKSQPNSKSNSNSNKSSDPLMAMFLKSSSNTATKGAKEESAFYDASRKNADNVTDVRNQNVNESQSNSDLVNLPTDMGITLDDNYPNLNQNDDDDDKDLYQENSQFGQQLQVDDYLDQDYVRKMTDDAGIDDEDDDAFAQNEDDIDNGPILHMKSLANIDNYNRSDSSTTVTENLNQIDQSLNIPGLSKKELKELQRHGANSSNTISISSNHAFNRDWANQNPDYIVGLMEKNAESDLNSNIGGGDKPNVIRHGTVNAASTDKVSGMSRTKGQITYLAANAKARSQQLEAAISRGQGVRHEAGKKYGW